MAYAKGTDVPVEKTEMEIKRLLIKHGATAIATGWQDNLAVVMFEMHNRRIRFSISTPPLSQFAVVKLNATSTRRRSPSEQKTALEQAQREKWRTLFLLIKGKLEALESGATLFEQEFLSYTVLPNNQTVSEWLEPQLNEVYRSGKMPPMLPGAPIALPAPKED